MIFDLRTLHLGDVLLALPAMRGGDSVIARTQHRVPGAPVAWLDAGSATVHRRCPLHATEGWLRATGRAPIRHSLLPAGHRARVVIAPHVMSERKRWSGWADLARALPDAVVVSEQLSRSEWMQLLNEAHTVICPDTGTAHMADALGVPRVVALHGMGREHFDRYHPYWTRGAHCVVRDTMDEISVADVLEAVNV